MNGYTDTFHFFLHIHDAVLIKRRDNFINWDISCELMRVGPVYMVTFVNGVASLSDGILSLLQTLPVNMSQ
jgi:hypothetical protein